MFADLILLNLVEISFSLLFLILIKIFLLCFDLFLDFIDLIANSLYL